MVQTAHTAIANARAQIDRRLARWILMAHDRTGDKTLALTHEFLALMLGVRRHGGAAKSQAAEADRHRPKQNRRAQPQRHREGSGAFLRGAGKGISAAHWLKRAAGFFRRRLSFCRFATSP